MLAPTLKSTPPKSGKRGDAQDAYDAEQAQDRQHTADACDAANRQNAARAADAENTSNAANRQDTARATDGQNTARTADTFIAHVLLLTVRSKFLPDFGQQLLNAFAVCFGVTVKCGRVLLVVNDLMKET